VNALKARVKNDIEEVASRWNEEERGECVGATANAFRFGGMVNAYLAGAHHSK